MVTWGQWTPEGGLAWGTLPPQSRQPWAWGKARRVRACRRAGSMLDGTPLRVTPAMWDHPARRGLTAARQHGATAQGAGRAELWKLMLRAGRPPPLARRNARRNLLADPRPLGKSGRPPLRAGRAALRTTSAMIPRRFPAAGRRGWGADGPREPPHSEKAPKGVPVHEVYPQPAAGASSRSKAVKDRQGAEETRHTEGRNASLPNYLRGIGDRSAYSCRKLPACGHFSRRILLYPAPVLKPCSGRYAERGRAILLEKS